MATLGVMLAAVLIALLIGLPLGIVAGRSNRLNALLSPILDVMQIMPTFAYLAPMTLLFCIGVAVGDDRHADLRDPAGDPDHGARASAASRATRSRRRRSLGSTRHADAAQGPAAAGPPGDRPRRSTRRSCSALSMVVITGADRRTRASARNIIVALSKVDVGAAFEAGLAIVILAIVLDRLTDRRRRVARSPRAPDRPPAQRPSWLAAVGRRRGRARRRADRAGLRRRDHVPGRRSRSRSPSRSTRSSTGSRRRSRR